MAVVMFALASRTLPVVAIGYAIWRRAAAIAGSIADSVVHRPSDGREKAAVLKYVWRPWDGDFPARKRVLGGGFRESSRDRGGTANSCFGPTTAEIVREAPS
jgi:hypothetical protein